MALLNPSLLEPNLILGQTILHLTPEIVRRNKIKGLILDVDETLVPIRQARASEDLLQWVTEMKRAADIWLVSNNLSHQRIGRIAEMVDAPYLLGAKKPSRAKLRKAMDAMDLRPQEVAMVGDRLFTDVLAGNRLGLFTILVEPMVDPLKANRKYPIRNAEVWLSKFLGASLDGMKHNFTKGNRR
ncbi:HAD superfamily (subfamily IIIA) phosphatase, TIGR01668 [[Leptolyngbya] sp. PCC 7376]|uniref:YqeG family HAD IIIA-type phosphatase n=1 Tax=[Leptolyngbya] sp. PCC 7376 TaxID=111781 RepID=UPI00029EFB89|nr:YqeG family HAD IIIA-type phosphatase [[Leptolyngbya] sp. PCC 7376]AFY38481.1 HAD superfamily (subfamily IIIA) phosphatase, TIGR01668 [[Leptolyngbya] sp. PCC 7376]